MLTFVKGRVLELDIPRARGFNASGVRIKKRREGWDGMGWDGMGWDGKSKNG